MVSHVRGDLDGQRELSREPSGISFWRAKVMAPERGTLPEKGHSAWIFMKEYW